MALVSMVVAYLSVNGFGLILPSWQAFWSALGGLFSGTDYQSQGASFDCHLGHGQHLRGWPH